MENLKPSTGVFSAPSTHRCEECGKDFKQKKHLLRHKRTVHNNSVGYECQICHIKINRKDNYDRHMQSHQMKRKLDCPPENESKRICTEENKQQNIPSNTETAMDTDPPPDVGTCIWCTQIKTLLPGKKFCKSCSDGGRECRWCHRPLPERFYSKRTDVCDRCLDRRERWKTQTGGSKSALDGSVNTTVLDPNPGNLWDVLQFFIDNNDALISLLHDTLSSNKGIKWFLTLYVKFVKYNQNNEAVYAEPTFRSINLQLTNGAEIKEQLAKAYQNLYNSYQNFERDGSGWSIDKILKMEVNIVEYIPLAGSSFIPLPSKIAKKKAILNIQNIDQKCFLWSVLATLHPLPWNQNPNLVSHYKQYANQLNIEGLEFPIPLSQIKKFEKEK